jgi:hypothetical protein
MKSLRGLVVAAVCLFGLLFVQAVYQVPFDAANASQIARRPWMPTEEITLDNGDVLVGYTISSKDGWFQILNDDDQTIMFVKATSITKRHVCTPEDDRVEYHDPLLNLEGAQAPKSQTCKPPT